MATNYLLQRSSNLSSFNASNAVVGIGVTAPSATLHVRSSFLVDDMITQFPPAAITSASTILTGAYPGQYSVTSSSNRNAAGDQYLVFDYNPTTYWQVTFPPTATTTVSGTVYTGEWVQLQSPYLFALTSYAVYSPTSGPTQWIIAGSTNGTTWILLDSEVNQNVSSLSTYTVQSSAYYYYRYIMMASTSIYPTIYTLNLYGNPQQIKSVGGATTIGGPLYADSLYSNGVKMNPRVMYLVNHNYGSYTNYSNNGSGNYDGAFWSTLNMITYPINTSVNLITSLTQTSIVLPYIGMWQFQISCYTSRNLANPVYLLYDGTTYYTSSILKTLVTGTTYLNSTTGSFIINNTNLSSSYRFGVYTGDDAIAVTYSSLTFLCTLL